MTDKTADGTQKPSQETVLTHTGRKVDEQFGFVNTPVYRGSTVLFKTLDEIENPHPRYEYGRMGNPSSDAVEAVITELEGAAGTVLAPSGLSAITLALLSVLEAGDEILVTDSAYFPTRRFGDNILKRLGVSVRYYDPRSVSGLAALVTDKTRLIYVESPGSLTFEVQDLPAIAGVARPRGIYVVVDNSWATPLYHKPLALGADMVIHAGTKMIVGHSDAMFGTVSANERSWAALRKTHVQLGLCASPDDCFLAARGLRTLALRMKEHSAHALELAHWLEGQPAVAAVYHPALKSHPDHGIFERDFSGSGSIFGVLLAPAPRAAFAAMLDGLTLFGLGFSWGGYESLCLPVHPEKVRTAVKWTAEGHMIRLHVGFEGMDDLKADLAAGLDRYRAAVA